MSYGMDYTEYDAFRLSLCGFCNLCYTNLQRDGMCICCGTIPKAPEQYHDLHVAADIYHNWQLTKFRAWRWNDAHRRGADIYKHHSVQIHHRSIYPEPNQFGLFLTDDQRKLARVIKKVWRQRRRESLNQRANANRWYRQWVWRPQPGTYTYQRWRTEIPRTEWMTYAIEEGLTYRHIRVYGYIPYVMEADELHREHSRIYFRAHERVEEAKARRRLNNN